MPSPWGDCYKALLSMKSIPLPSRKKELKDPQASFTEGGLNPQADT